MTTENTSTPTIEVVPEVVLPSRPQWEIALAQPTTEIEKKAYALFKSKFWGELTNWRQAQAKMEMGRALGINDAMAQMGLFITQQGKLGMTAHLMAHCILTHKWHDGKAKYRYEIPKLTDQECEIVVEERVELDSSGHWEWRKKLPVKTTIKQFDFLCKGKNAANWKNYPQNMLFARCLSNVAKFHCADCFGGSPVYLPDEIPNSGIEVSGDTLEVVSVKGESFQPNVRGAVEDAEVELGEKAKALHRAMKEQNLSPESIAQNFSMDLGKVLYPTEEEAEKLLVFVSARKQLVR